MLTEEIRTFRQLSLADTREVSRHAFAELDRFLNAAGSPPGKYSRYADRLIAICLAQGAAQHFVDLEEVTAFDNEVHVGRAKVKDKGFRVLPNGRVISGIKDIDVIFFFREDERLPLPIVRHLRKSVTAHFPTLGERRLDFMKKSMSEEIVAKARGEHPRDIVRSYLQGTRHGLCYLSKKSVIGLYPEDMFCEPVWRTKRWTGAA